MPFAYRYRSSAQLIFDLGTVDHALIFVPDDEVDKRLDGAEISFPSHHGGDQNMMEGVTEPLADEALSCIML